MWFITEISFDPLREDTDEQCWNQTGGSSPLEAVFFFFLSGKICSFQFVEFLQSSDEMETNTGNRLLKLEPNSSEDYMFLTHNHDVVKI